MAAELELSIAVQQPKILAGEVLTLTVTIRNIGAADVLFDDPQSISPYGYEFRRCDNGELVETYSADEYWAWSQATAPPAAAPPPILGTGDQWQFHEELRGHSATAGRYHLCAYLSSDDQHFRSSAAILEIEPIQDAAHVAAHCPTDEVFASLVAHHGAEETVILGQIGRSATQDDDPLSRLATGLSGKINGLALAFPSYVHSQKSWFAWVQGQTLTACQRAHASLSTEVHGSVALSESPVQLLETGFQTRDDSAVFFAVDHEGGRIVHIHFSPTGMEAKSFAAPWETAPERIALVGFGVPDISDYRMVWAVNQGDTTDIYAAPLTANEGGAGDAPPILLHRSALPLAAWAITPLVWQEEAQLQALWGPDDEGQMAYQRIRFGPQPPTSETWCFPPPDGDISSWAVGHAEGEELPVVARLDDAPFFNDAAAVQQWVGVFADLNTDHHRIWSTEAGAHWLIWLDDQRGPQCLLVAGDDSAGEEDDGEEDWALV
jgi:hypothetical protein